MLVHFCGPGFPLQILTGSGITSKLVKHGNSAALVIDKPILELLHIGLDTPLDISTDGKTLTITPGKDDREKRIRAALKKVNTTHAATLRKLSK